MQSISRTILLIGLTFSLIPQISLSSNSDPDGCQGQSLVTVPPRLQELMAQGRHRLCLGNCFNAALYAHYPLLTQRYMTDREFSYFLNRDFERTSRFDLRHGGTYFLPLFEPGDILVFDSRNEHVAYYLGDGMVFDVRGPSPSYPYRIIHWQQTHLGQNPRFKNIRNGPIAPGEPTVLKQRDPFLVFSVHRRKVRSKETVLELELDTESRTLVDKASLFNQKFEALLSQELSYTPRLSPEQERDAHEFFKQVIARLSVFNHVEGLHKVYDPIYGQSGFETLLKFESLMEAYRGLISGSY